MAITGAEQPPDWLASLSTPAPYPHPVGTVRLLETHISWVFLTGDWAYKLKKPVNLGFVDFTTLELRHTACDEELRLNRRTAPTLYDAVIPLTRTDQGPQFGGAGTILDYAVRMRQFNDDALLACCLERHELTRVILAQLALEIADLHLQAAVAKGVTPFGEPELVRQTVQACLDALDGGVCPDAHQSTVEELNQWTNSEWKRLYSTFESRKRQGSVRECHGDLHLGNLVIFEGKPTLFDCLEFNSNLRWIDVLSDIAFLVMDLIDRGIPEDGWYLLNCYLERTGDFEGITTLRYFLTYRALVRAKVAAIRLRQPGLTANDQNDQKATLDSYLSLAQTLTRPYPVSMVLMHGLCGSGKTRVAQVIAASLPAIHIRSDVERKRLAGLWPSLAIASKQLSADELYSDTASQATYARLEILAREVIIAGHSVVIDAASLRRDQRARFALLAAELSVPLTIVACTAPRAVLEERVRQRQSHGKDASDGDVRVLREQASISEPFEPSEKSNVIEIDTSQFDGSQAIEQIRQRSSAR